MFCVSLTRNFDNPRADFKSDNCATYAMDPSVRFGAFRDALNRTGRPIVFSIEPFSAVPDPEQSSLVSNLARVACDSSAPEAVWISRADINDKWAPLAHPGGTQRHRLLLPRPVLQPQG